MENTSLNAAQEPLQNIEERYKLLVEGVKDYGIFMLSPEGLIISWNEGARRLKGYEERKIIGQHFSIFYTEEAKSRNYPQFELQQAEKIGRFEDEGIRVKKNGSTFYANVVITAIYDKSGALKGFSKITRDLTERKEAEERLRQSEEKYRMLINGIRDYAIFLLDPNGIVSSWNEGAKRLNGYSEEEIVGKNFSILYTKEKQEAGYPTYELEQAAKLGKFEDEGIRVRKDGSTFYVNAIVTPLFSGKKLIGFTKITRDLSEKKKSEDEMINLNLQLEQKVKDRTAELTKTVNELKLINSDLDNFIYTASHDLKAPVSNIEGLMESLGDMLLENGFLAPEIENVLQMINTSVDRFQHTIRDLTSINEIQRTGREDLMQLNLQELVEDVTVGIDRLIKESNAEITIEIEDTLHFHFSRMHMRSLIYNLLTNAIKYRSLERTPKIRLEVCQKGNDFVMRVTDNGLGIKEEYKGKIFQLFHRLHDHVEGTGTGLYIVRKIVDTAGGHVEVTSKEGVGTTFEVVLPIQRAQ